MSNQDLIDQYRKANLPADLSDALEQLIQAATALRPVFPPEFVYRVKFAERTTLREVLSPDEHSSHWWHTGLYIIREGIREHDALDTEFGTALDTLHTLLTARLGPYDAVTLREIDSDTVTGICLLSELMDYPQTTFVAPNSYSLAQALFSKTAWYRAVYAGKAPVGFIMLDDNTEKPEYFLWRFMIAPPFQRSGFGRQAIERLIDYVKTRPGAKELKVSYIDHEEGPRGFYRGLGFRETGEVDDGEVMMRMEL